MRKFIILILLLFFINNNVCLALDEEVKKDIQDIIKYTMKTKYKTAYDARDAADKYIAEKYNSTIRTCRYDCENEYSQNRAKANNFNVFKTTKETNKDARSTAFSCMDKCNAIQDEAREYYLYIRDYLEKNYSLKSNPVLPTSKR